MQMKCKLNADKIQVNANDIVMKWGCNTNGMQMEYR